MAGVPGITKTSNPKRAWVGCCLIHSALTGDHNAEICSSGGYQCIGALGKPRACGNGACPCCWRDCDKEGTCYSSAIWACFLERSTLFLPPAGCEQQDRTGQYRLNYDWHPDIDGAVQVTSIQTSRTSSAHRGLEHMSRMAPRRSEAKSYLATNSAADWCLWSPLQALGRIRPKSAGMTTSASALC